MRDIESIDVSWNRLTSAIPSSTQEFESLASLNLLRNSFQGSMPQSIGHLKGFEFLDLSYNELSNTILESLEGLAYLQILNLSINKLSGEIPNCGPFGNFLALFSLGMKHFLKCDFSKCDTFRMIRHRNLVKVTSTRTNANLRALALQYVPCGSLEKWLYSNNYNLDLHQRVKIVVDAATAIEYLHHDQSEPIVHCDLKPSNILLNEGLVAQVFDFGIAKILVENKLETQTQTLDTIGYIAPSTFAEY
ncbi:receptor kinase-like protein Xa21 [Eucalyptus grandis]|uniref:receptor kinase-like protein Xa21 n=1 Tax=Eucalyptus grandis TaxID=71139 RepID=UPI00192EC8D1|nr:receptor kinase-like protein Xa21 [Eucalyptus grandis]